LVVLLGVDRLRDKRVPAVCSDDHAGVFGNSCATFAVPAYADGALAFADD
jgi:hypothetical protein